MDKKEVYISLAQAYVLKRDLIGLTELTKKEGIKPGLLYTLYASSNESLINAVLKDSKWNKNAVKEELRDCGYTPEQIDNIFLSINKPELASKEALVKAKNWHTLITHHPEEVAKQANIEGETSSLWELVDSSAPNWILLKFKRTKTLIKREAWDKIKYLPNAFDILKSHGKLEFLLFNSDDCKSEIIKAIKHFNSLGENSLICSKMHATILVIWGFARILRAEKHWDDLWNNNQQELIDFEDWYQKADKEKKAKIINRAREVEHLEFLSAHNGARVIEILKEWQSFYKKNLGYACFMLFLICINFLAANIKEEDPGDIALLTVTNVIVGLMPVFNSIGSSWLKLKDVYKYSAPLIVLWLASLVCLSA